MSSYIPLFLRPMQPNFISCRQVGRKIPDTTRKRERLVGLPCRLRRDTSSSPVPSYTLFHHEPLVFVSESPMGSGLKTYIDTSCKFCYKENYLNTLTITTVMLQETTSKVLTHLLLHCNITVA